MLEILPQLLVNALIAGSIYALVSFGLSLSYGLLRILNFAHGHLMMLGAYFFWYAHEELELALPTAALATVIAVSLCALLIYRSFVEPFLRYSFLLVFLTTLALSNILEASVSMAFGVNVRAMSSSAAVESFELLGVYITPIQCLIVAVTVLLMTAGAFVVHSTSSGRRLRAVAENAYAAQSLGISAQRLYVGSFITSTLVAALAGVLVAYELNIQPTMGSQYTIRAFAAMVLGGLGSIWGTVVGAYLLSLFENLAVGLQFGSFSIPAGYKDAVAFFVILLILLFRPSGLFQRRGRKV